MRMQARSSGIVLRAPEVVSVLMIICRRRGQEEGGWVRRAKLPALKRVTPTNATPDTFSLPTVPRRQGRGSPQAAARETSHSL